MNDKITATTQGLTSSYSRSLAQLSNQNAVIICDYITAMRTETNLSDNYRKGIIKTLGILSRFSKDKPFKSMIRDDVVKFLNRLRKPDNDDPLHKWIGTYNHYNTLLIRFFKWLYNPELPANARPKPKILDNIVHLKRREISIYQPTDLWTEEDDLLFMKYCPSKRIKCYHAISRDASARPHEILKLKIKDVMFKSSNGYQYAETSLNGKTGIRPTSLINSIPYVKDYLDHEHPQPTNLDAPFICGVGKSLGKHLLGSTLSTLYINYKKEYFPSLLDSPNISSEDKQRIRDLLRKPFNPYIRRHTAITEKSLNPQIFHVLTQHAGWVAGSSMIKKYTIHFANASNKAILQAHGIIKDDKEQSDTLKPKQCPHCNEGNKPDAKFCANVKCRMTLTYDGYAETQEKERQRDMEVIKLSDRVKDLEQIKEDLCKMHDEYRDAMQKEMNMTDEERKKEHEMELRSAYPPGKYKYVKLMEESENGQWQEIIS